MASDRSIIPNIVIAGIGRRKINHSHVFAGQEVGIKEISEKIWLVSLMHYDLGFFDQESGRVECAENPFAEDIPLLPGGGRAMGGGRGSGATHLVISIA